MHGVRDVTRDEKKSCTTGKTMVSCPIECVKDQPDFIERNGAWLLSVIASVSVCFGYCLSYFLKSRCKTIDCCGVKCDRTPIELQPSDVEIVPRD